MTSIDGGLYEFVFWGQFWDPMGTCLWIISAGSSFRRVRIEWCGHIYLCSGRPTFFFWFEPTSHIFWTLKWTKWFSQKSMFLKIEQKILLRATKNLKIISACSLGSQVYPTILVWRCYALFGIYGGSYVKNGRFLSFFNSAGVLVQPWIRILMSKFEVFLECWKHYSIACCTWNYVFFGWTNIFFYIHHQNSKFLEFLKFFFFQNSGWIRNGILIIFLISCNFKKISCATCLKIKIFISDHSSMHKLSKFWLVVVYKRITKKYLDFNMRYRNGVFRISEISFRLGV